MLHKLERLATGQWFYWNTEVQDVDVKNPEHRINAVVEFSADRNTMDIKYQTPRANTSMINLDLPYDVMPVGALVPWNYARIFGMTSPGKSNGSWKSWPERLELKSFSDIF